MSIQGVSVTPGRGYSAHTSPDGRFVTFYDMTGQGTAVQTIRFDTKTKETSASESFEIPHRRPDGSYDYTFHSRDVDSIPVRNLGNGQFKYLDQNGGNAVTYNPQTGALTVEPLNK